MLQRFLEAYPPVPDETPAADPRRLWRRGPVAGFVELMTSCPGRSFGNGIYRLHSQLSGQRADRMVARALPWNAKTAYCFGYDWLGRQFALDGKRIEGGEPSVLFIDLLERRAYEIDASFVESHNRILIEKAHAALSADLFRQWTAKEPAHVPLQRHRD
jgi:hypothetical protein